jgi:hypothetical protein
MVNSDKEYLLSANYIVAKNAGLRIHYDSDMVFGIRVNLSY